MVLLGEINLFFIEEIFCIKSYRGIKNTQSLGKKKKKQSIKKFMPDLS